MIKIILGTLISVLILVTTAVIFYWRDIKYDPTGSDFLIFFGLIPVAITTLILTPLFIKKIYQSRQEKKELQQAEEQHRAEQQAHEEQQEVKDEIEWIELNVLSATSLSALAENEVHIAQLKEAVSPELDPQLVNAYGLPILSYRIQDIDDAFENDDEFSHLSQRQQRISALIQHQLEQNAEALYQIATHLKNSAMYYDTKLAHEYRMHPAWIDPNSEYEDDVEEQRVAEAVSRLNRLNIHLILPENLFHAWDENSGKELISQYLNELGIISQQFDTEYHYWGETTAYKDWIKLLKRTQTLDADVSWFIAVDSEIDQETIDDHTWMTEKYIPSEYISSCFLTAKNVEIQNFPAVKNLHIALNTDQASNILKEKQLAEASQFESEQPFVLVLDDPAEIKSLKKLEKNFENTPVEAHHYLYSKNSLGHTQPLSKVFGFMLSLHMNDEMFAYVYSADHQQTQVLIGNESA